MDGGETSQRARMRTTDIAIVGGGLAGSMTAAMLGRAGIDAVLIDPHRVYPDDFRCEKLGGPQIPLLQKTGLTDAVFRKSTHDREVWIAQYGHLIDRRPSDQRGILYQDLVGAIRDEIPAAVPFIEGKAASIATDDDRQIVTLSDGGTLSTRLVVLANGLNLGLLKSLGIRRRVVSPCHSITIGFDLAPVGRPAFAFPALTYYPERATERMAYLTLFPVGATMRANLMVYRPIDDPWLREMREAPEAALHRLMPRLHRLTGNCRVLGPVRIRPADLYVTEGHRQSGIVLVGDAFATSCPAAGTGCDKVFTDVARLCGAHIPQWLASDGMSADKIAAFYDDPQKRDCDARSAAKAQTLRALSTEPGAYWTGQRLARFVARGAAGLIRPRTGLRQGGADKTMVLPATGRSKAL